MTAEYSLQSVESGRLQVRQCTHNRHSRYADRRLYTHPDGGESSLNDSCTPKPTFKVFEIHLL